MPWLVSGTRCRAPFSETWQWLQRLGTQALGAETMKPALNTRPKRRTCWRTPARRRGGRARARPHLPLAGTDWRRRRQPRSLPATMGAQAQPTLAALLPGCGFESLLPDAYYVSNREADRRVRPLRAAISWLEGAVNLEASQLRAVVAGGESRIDEYRIGFTARNSNDVYYGCVWPLYGREEDLPADEGQPDVVDETPRCSRNTASTTCAAFPACRPTTARTAARPTSRIRWANWCTPSCPRTPRPRRPSSTRKRDAGRHLLPGRRQLRRHRRAGAWPAGWPRFRAGGRACGSTTGPSPASSPGWTRNRRASNAWASTSSTGRRRRPPTPGDVVIEAFACDPPDAFLDAMRQVHPVWINLEYLSAEVWIESCHGLPSQRPDGLVKHFYFPGFTRPRADAARAAVRRTRRAAGFARTTGVRARAGVPQHALSRRRDGARLVSLFCYPDAPVDALASALAADPRPTVLLAPEGVAPGLKRPAPRRAAPPWSGCSSSASRTSTACCGAPT